MNDINKINKKGWIKEGDFKVFEDKKSLVIRVHNYYFLFSYVDEGSDIEQTVFEDECHRCSCSVYYDNGNDRKFVFKKPFILMLNNESWFKDFKDMEDLYNNFICCSEPIAVSNLFMELQVLEEHISNKCIQASYINLTDR